MRKKTTQKKNKLTSILKQVRASGILPFAEKPSDDTVSVKDGKQKEGNDDRIGASDLFSLFTANIIKEEVIFTR
jgi:hypothetical protein